MNNLAPSQPHLSHYTLPINFLSCMGKVLYKIPSSSDIIILGIYKRDIEVELSLSTFSHYLFTANHESLYNQKLLEFTSASSKKPVKTCMTLESS